MRLTPSEARKLGIVVDKKSGHAQIKRRLPDHTVKRAAGGIRLTIYDIPPSLNEWQNLYWAKKAVFKRRWEKMIMTLLFGVRQVDKPVVRITYYPDCDRSRDKDNYTPKFIMDGLKKSGVITDDNTQAVDVDWSIATGVVECARTEIVIMPKDG